MTEPIESDYDETPLEVPDEDDADSDEESPDNGKDLSYMVPHAEVAWDTPPSFNKDPKDIDESAGDKPPKEITEPSGDLKIDLSALRTTEKALLTESRAAVKKYEELRTKVAAVKGTVFGQTAMDKGKEGSGHTSLSAGFDPQTGKSHKNPFQDTAKEFAAEMNPAMERTLLQIGSTLEKLGEYIALLNHSGQVYAKADRDSRFPDPPS